LSHLYTMPSNRHIYYTTFFVLFAYFTFQVECTAWAELAEDEDSSVPVVIPLETRQLGIQNLRQLGLSRQKIQRLISDCNSNAIVRAIRRPNIISDDSVKLRICLSLLDVLQNGSKQSTLRQLLYPDEILMN